MQRPRARTTRPLQVQRGFERARLEDDLVAAAYALAVPIQRRSRSSAGRHATSSTSSPQQSAPAGGLSA